VVTHYGITFTHGAEEIPLLNIGYIHLWAAVNMVMNLQVPYKVNFLTS
jgi:hypothetical protein